MTITLLTIYVSFLTHVKLNGLLLNKKLDTPFYITFKESSYMYRLKSMYSIK